MAENFPLAANARAVRSAEPGRKCKNGECKKTGEKKMKTRRAKGLKCKNRKCKNGRKGKNGRKKKSNKGNKERGKGSKRKINPKNGTDEGTATVSETCFKNAVFFMRKMNEKVINFENQKKRNEKFAQICKSKSKKSKNFLSMVTMLREVGGGNSTDLRCNKKKNAGAGLLTKLTKSLETCDSLITRECVTNVPPMNSTYLDYLEACYSEMKKFRTKTQESMVQTPSEACKIWDSSELNNLYLKFKNCSVTTLLGAKLAKEKCKASMIACRNDSDAASVALTACSPANSEENLKAAIAAGTANQKVAKEVTEKVNGLLSLRMARAGTPCKVFAGEVTAVSQMVVTAPLLPSLLTKLRALMTYTVDTCSLEDKKVLTTSRDELMNGSDSIMKAIKQKEKLLMVSTGMTFVPGTVTEGTKESTTKMTTLLTTAASSTEPVATTTTKMTTLLTMAASSTEPVATTTTKMTTLWLHHHQNQMQRQQQK